MDSAGMLSELKPYGIWRVTRLASNGKLKNHIAAAKLAGAPDKY